MKHTLRIVLIVLAGIATLAAVNFAPMISLKTPGMREYTANGITVYATEKDSEEVETLTARIAEQSAGVTDALGGADGTDVGVIIYADQKALHRKTIGLAGALLPSWFIGDNTKEYVLITSPAEPGPSHTRESIEQAAVHEYVHVMTDRVYKQLGYWLKEGIALYLAEQTPESAAIRTHSDLTWEEFSNPNAIQFAEVGGYTMAYTLIEYLEANHGWQTVVDLVSGRADYQSALGMSERELYDRWIRAVRGA